ncbi:MAG: FAD-dependent oxidoreductase [Candidatus Eisenbacteria bacterium]|uniref:FAD-dependent oxidoreductase n=1 Tax=Eiseniibacteriota bacterium TaxID=2212470 RepID=A0A7Y2E6M1_UNCEI|nr:FAD-dependent oxidoreductase [Candidatus Eisenbacteria bacterium]
MYHLMTAGASKGRPFAKHPSYEDARMNDARFVWELVREARVAGAHASSHTRLESLGEPGQEFMAGGLRDQLTGEVHEVRGRVWINATGPWASEKSGASLRLTRGSHVILRGELPGAAQLFFAPEDGRVLFLLPFVPGYSLLGTTDLDEEAPAAHPVATREEVSYLGRAFQSAFPEYAPWKPVSLQCGYRPLLPSGGRPSQISREEKLLADPDRPLLSILGGKYTTYRAVSERAVDWCDRALGRNGISHPTRTRRFPSGRDLDRLPEAADLDELLSEDVVTLEDLMLRRTPWGYLTEWREFLDLTCAKLGDKGGQQRAWFESRQEKRLEALEAWPEPAK